MKYKIVFIDIDDTLTYNKNPIGEKTKKIMQKLKEKNILVVINSGRDNLSATKRSIEGNLSSYIISSNGAEIYDRVNKKMIRNCSLPKETVKEISTYALAHDMGIYFNCMQKQYRFFKGDQGDKEQIDYILNKNEVNQIVITSKNYDRMISIPDLFKEKFPGTHIVHSSAALVEKRRKKGEMFYHDIVVEQTTKATGIVDLLDYLHLEQEEAIAIGNGYDDLPMKEVVQTFIAVENAKEKVKEAADLIAPSVKEEGVATILNQLLLEENAIIKK